MKQLNQIFEKLNLSKEKGLYLANEPREKLFSNRVERLLENTIKPDAFFCIDNKPFILFFENLGSNKKEKLRNIWNFNESPIVIILEQGAVEIFNGFEYLSKTETLKLFGNDEKLTDFKYFELVTGKTWKKYEEDFSTKNRIDFHLLKNIKSARDILIKQSVSQELTNSLIGKIIFVRYLIDRGIKLDFEQRGKSRKLTNKEFCNLLSDKKQVKEFFKYLKNKFNGDLFPITEKEIDSIPTKSFSTLIDLLYGNEVASGQQSLFNLYDFSIIPVEFISNVYEVFIGQNQQEEQGAYYTPLFLIDYILVETVEKHLQENNSHTCKVLDPACGSGIFLVETLRKIIEKYQENNPNYLKNIDKYKDDLKQLASDNIFGIDKDKSAISVAIFSIYLTLLDYQNPSDIENFKFPHLENKNFFSSDFFDTEAIFNTKIKGISFNYIIGNPPWKEYGIGKKGKTYLKKRLQKEKLSEKKYPIAINNGEVVEGFIFRVSDFCQSQTKIALIVRSTILYNKGYSEYSGFRQYFLEEFYIDKIFELAPVRFEVFDNSNDPSIAPAAVLFYRYSNGVCTDRNIIEHISIKPSRFFSLFKIFSINRTDFKSIEQINLKTYDWLWKVLVYGSYLDFNLILRLKKEYISLKDILSNKTQFKKGTGITLSKKPDENSSHLVGLPFLDSYAVKPFYIENGKTEIFQYEKVGRKRDANLFKGPILLIRNGLDTKSYKPKAAIYKSDVVYKKALTGIKPLPPNGISILKNILGNINSDLYPYLAINTFSSIGIEREQTKEYEKFDIPFVENGIEKFVSNIIEATETLNNIKKQPLVDNYEITRINNVIQKNLQDLNKQIFEYLNIRKNSTELSLIEYSLGVIRPLMTKNISTNTLKYLFNPISLNSYYLKEYINLFFDRFNPVYKKNNQKLVVEVKHTNQILGLFFKLVSLNSEEHSIKLTHEKNTNILEFLSSLGVEKLTDRLFIQKDIRGFEKDGFYIIKPNERKLWHKAIGHLDVDEFMDAILIAGKKNKFNV